MNQDVNSDIFKKLPQAVTYLDYTLLSLDNNGHWDEFIFGQGIGVLLSFSLMKREQSQKHFLFIHWCTIGARRECQNLISKKCV